MKILKHGTPYCWTEQVTCSGRGNGGNGCKAILEVEEADLFHTRRGFFGKPEYAEELVTIECPECKIWTDLNSDKIPSKILDNILKMKYSTTSGGITRQLKSERND